MATATMIYNGAADGNTSATLTHIGNVDDAVVAHFFDAYRANFGQIQDKDANGVLLWLDTNNVQQAGAAPQFGLRPKMRDMTDAETWEKYTQGIAAGTAALVQRYLQQLVVAQAMAAIPNVTVNQQS